MKKTTAKKKTAGKKAASVAKPTTEYKSLRDCALLDKVVVPCLGYGHIYSFSIQDAKNATAKATRTTTAVVIGKNSARTVVCLGFEKADDISYPDTFSAYPGYEDVADEVIRTNCFNKQIWFDWSNVMEFAGVYEPKLKLKKLSETPYILAQDIMVGDTVCFAENNNVMYMSVSEIEESEVGEVATVCLRGVCHKPGSSMVVMLPLHTIDRLAKVILIDRNGEEQ
jgi:hypothetical protein